MHISKKHFFSALVLVIFGSALYAGTAFAATVYVSNSATNGYASGNDAYSYAQAQDKSTPFLTVTGAINKVSSGDTIMINDGTYTESFSLIPADDNLTFTNDPVTGASYGVIIKVSSGIRVFYTTAVSPYVGYTIGPIVLDADNTVSSVITGDSSTDIGTLTLNGTKLLNPTGQWISTNHIRNITTSGSWQASANTAGAFAGFLVHGAASNNGTYNFTGGTITVTNTGAVNSYAFSSTPVASGLTINFTNNTVHLTGNSASAQMRVFFMGGAGTANITGNTVTLDGTASSMRLVQIQDQAVALTVASNDVTATATLATIAGVFGSGLSSANIYSNTFDYSGATISTSSTAITISNGTGTTSSCTIHDNSGDINATDVGVTITVGDDADPGANANHISACTVYGNDFANANHGYLISYSNDNVVYNNTMDNAVIGFISKYSDNNTFSYNIASNITSGGALRDKGSSGSVFYNNIATAASGGVGILTSDGATTAIYKNNIVWTDQASMKFVSLVAGSATLDNNIYYSTQSLPADAWVNDVTTYNTLSGWQGAGFDANSLNTNPLLTDAPGGNYTPTSTSPAIDAGVDASLTADHAGNVLYGVPDIGAYEYQPPYTFAVDGAPVGGAVRLYIDGQYRVTTTGSGTATFAVAPSGGYTADTTEYMNVSIDAWSTTGTEAKQWTVSSTSGTGKTQAGDTLYTIGDLTASKKYNLEVDGAVSASLTGYGDTTCTDGICNANGSGVLQFVYTGGYATTRVFTADLLQTAITNTSVTILSPTSVRITWTTNDAADSTVQYGLTALYGSTVNDTDLVTSHSITLTGLTPGTTYHYNVLSEGNTSASSADATFVTDAATSITNVTATVLSTTSVRITWTTNHAADSTVQYGLTTAYGSEEYDAALVSNHSITLTGLTPGTTYHYKVLSEGNTSTSSADDTFVTDAEEIPAPTPDPEGLTGFADVQLNGEDAEDGGSLSVISVLKSGSIVLEGTAEADANITLRIASSDEYTTTSNGSGYWSVTIAVRDTVLDLGTHAVYGTVTKGGTSTDEEHIATFTLYSPEYLPSPTIIAPQDSKAVIATNPLITGLARSGNTVHIYIDDARVATVQATTDASGTGHFSYQMTSGLAAGTHTIYVVAVDGSDASRNSPVTTFTVEAPFIGVTFLAARVVVSDPTPHLAVSGIGAGGSRVEFFLNGTYLDRIGLLHGHDSVEHFTYKVPLDDMAPGGYTLYAIAYDDNGKPSRRSNIISFTKMDGADASVLVTSLGATIAPEQQTQRVPLPTAIGPGPGGTYTVQRGDSLWKIAQEQLGNGARYRELIVLNQSVHPELVSNPGAIHAGWVLRLP